MPGQQSFIKVIDKVLSDDLCSQFIRQFDSSQHKSVGSTGGGVDIDKKRSLDVSVSQHPEFQQQMHSLLPLVSE